MANEVSEEDVMFIVTRTLCPNYETFMQVVEQYYEDGTPITRTTNSYALREYELTKVKELATRLYYSGRIHQPRVFDNEGRKEGHHYQYNHPARLGQGLWMQVVPTNDNTTPAVVDAWEKYKMLDNLTK
jgi:arginine repressor